MFDKSYNLAELHANQLRHLKPEIKLEILADFVMNPAQFSKTQRNFLQQWIGQNPNLKKEYDFLVEFKKKEYKLEFVTAEEKEEKIVEKAQPTLNVKEKLTDFISRLFLKPVKMVAAADVVVNSIILKSEGSSTQVKLFHFDQETYASIISLDESLLDIETRIILITDEHEYSSDDLRLRSDLEGVFLADIEIPWQHVRGIRFDV